jgi:type IV secretory pathway TrbF-like protein
MNLLPKPATDAAIAEAVSLAPQPSPEWREAYRHGRQEWLERYGDYIAAARSWRRIAFLAIAEALIATGGLIIVAMQGQVVPYVVQVDKLGAVAALDRADRMAQPETPLIVAQIGRWITAVRSVYADAAAQRALINEGYAMINRLGEAYGALNEHMRASDPFERARSETVSVTVQSVLPLAGNTWRVEWREDVRPRDGSAPVSSQYQASITIGFSPPRDEATLRANPLGLYVNAFSWAKRL